MKEPENYRDLIVRVASYCSYFVELSEIQQLDIIDRTEQQGCRTPSFDKLAYGGDSIGVYLERVSFSPLAIFNRSYTI
jgi:hypothetical protein